MNLDQFFIKAQVGFAAMVIALVAVYFVFWKEKSRAKR